MSVLFLGPLPEPLTGHALACRVLLDGLVLHERVEVIDLNKSGFKQGVDSLERILQVGHILWRVWRSRNACDVIYFTITESIAGNLKDLLIYLLCFRRLSRMVIHLHGGAGLIELLRKRAILEAANSFFMKRLGAAIVLGERHVAIFEGRIDRSRIHIVPNFAEDEVFVDAASVDAKFDEAGPLRVLFLSNMHPGKGHLELAAAFLMLDERARARMQVDFAGAFESEEQRLQFVELAGRDSRMRYHGSVRGAAKIALFRRAHVFCLPTYYPYEGQPISILEAYAAGCAVITTDHSGIGDIFQHAVNGFEVSKRSAPALKEALEKAGAGIDQLRAIALRNLETAQRKYRVERYVQDVIRVITHVREGRLDTGNVRPALVREKAGNDGE